MSQRWVAYLLWATRMGKAASPRRERLRGVGWCRDETTGRPGQRPSFPRRAEGFSQEVSRSFRWIRLVGCGFTGRRGDPAGYDIDDGAVTALSCTEAGDVFAFLATGACQRWRLEPPLHLYRRPARRASRTSPPLRGFFSPPPTGTVKKPWVCHAAACVAGNTIVAAQAAGELSRIVILSYHDDELRRPCL